MRLYAAIVLMLFALSPTAHAKQKGALFLVSGGGEKDNFVIALFDPAKIAEARAIASGAEKSKVHVGGLIVRKAARYNKPWHFHLAPKSIAFFEMAIEVCDATTSYVETHLDEVGGAFLPKGHWCPWSSRVVREIK